jgi:16S rRNA (cytidine1402-2'-O)-methyltransferase
VPLILAGAPIGHVGDAGPRLAEALAGAELVAAEDTRRLHRLCADLGVTVNGQLVSYFEGNEAQRTPQLLDALRAGSRVVLVTDAGMPTVSDPGYRLVAAAAAEGLPVTCVPGPVGGHDGAGGQRPADRPLLLRGLPAAQGRRAAARLAELQAERRTCVLFEAPHRLADALADMAAVLGPTRRAVVCRELTKTYEEVVRGTLPELAPGPRAASAARSPCPRGRRRAAPRS